MLQLESHYDSFREAAEVSKAAKGQAVKEPKAAKSDPPQPLRRSRRPAAIEAAKLLSTQPTGTPERESPNHSDNAYEPDSGGTGMLRCASPVSPATPSSPWTADDRLPNTYMASQICTAVQACLQPLAREAQGL